MATTIYVPGTYTYQGQTGSGTEVLGLLPIQSQDLTCSSIQNALQDAKAPTAYPVDCSFATLSQTGVVFFMDPNNQQLVSSLEVNIGINADPGFNKDDIDFIYSVETGFIATMILVITLIRNLRKISPLLF